MLTRIPFFEIRQKQYIKDENYKIFKILSKIIREDIKKLSREEILKYFCMQLTG